MINGIIIVALIVVAIFAVKGSIRQFTYGCCGTKDVEKKIKVQDKKCFRLSVLRSHRSGRHEMQTLQAPCGECVQ